MPFASSAATLPSPLASETGRPSHVQGWIAALLLTAAAVGVLAVVQRRSHLPLQYVGFAVALGVSVLVYGTALRRGWFDRRHIWADVLVTGCVLPLALCAWGGVRDLIPEPPSTYYYRQMFCCFFRDKHGVASLDVVGRDNATFETDYPHVDSTFPHTKEVALDHVKGLDDETVYKLMRGNAIRMLDLDFDRHLGR